MALTYSITLEGYPNPRLAKGDQVLIRTVEDDLYQATVNCLINKPCILCGEPVIMPEEGQSWCNPCRKSPERREVFLKGTPCVHCGAYFPYNKEEFQVLCDTCNSKAKGYGQADRNDPAFCLQCQDYCGAAYNPYPAFSKAEGMVEPTKAEVGDPILSCNACATDFVQVFEGQVYCMPCLYPQDDEEALEDEGFLCGDCGYLRSDLREPCRCEPPLPTHPDYRQATGEPPGPWATSATPVSYLERFQDA